MPAGCPNSCVAASAQQSPDHVSTMIRGLLYAIAHVPPCFTAQTPAVTDMRKRGLRQNAVHKAFRIERRKIVGSFAQAHQLDGHAQLLLHGDHDAALGRAIELG